MSEINLPNNRLAGTLPHEIALAGIGEQILYIDVSGNNIGGKIVSEIGTFKNLGKREYQVRCRLIISTDTLM